MTASVRCSTTSGDGSSAAIGRTDEAHERHRRAVDLAGRFTEPLHHALFDLALAAVEVEDAATARAWLAQVEVPPDDAGAMAWHQRHRQHLLEARVALIEGDPATAARLAAWVRDDAARRGAARRRRPGRGRAAPGGGDDRAGDDAAGRRHGRRPSTTSPGSRPGGSPPASPPPPTVADLWAAAERYAEQLVAACGPDADRVRAWTQSELHHVCGAKRRIATLSLHRRRQSGR